MSSLSNNELFTTTCWTRSSIQIYEKKKICHPLNRRSCEIFHAWPLSPTPFIFLSFSLAFHCISIFLISSKQIFFTFVPEYFPAETIFSNVFTKFSRISPRNNISKESVSVKPFSFHRANETSRENIQANFQISFVSNVSMYK